MMCQKSIFRGVTALLFACFLSCSGLADMSVTVAAPQQAIIAPAFTISAAGINAIKGFPLPFYGAVGFIDSTIDLCSTAFSAQVDWGDGTTSQAYLTPPCNYHGGVKNGDLEAVHIYTHAGAFLFTLTVQVNGTKQQSMGTAIVTPTIPISVENIEARPNTAFSGTVAIARIDHGMADDIMGLASIAINWGDGSLTSGTAYYDDDKRALMIQGAHDYSIAATVSITVTLLYHQHIIATGSNIATIKPSILVVEVQPISATTGSAFSGTIASVYNRSSAKNIDMLQFTIDWGDSTIPGAGSFANLPSLASVDIPGTHIYSTAGTFTITVIVSGIRDLGNGPTNKSETTISTGTAVVVQSS